MLDCEKFIYLWKQSPKQLGLPTYEDVAIGNIGSFVDHVALIERGGNGYMVMSCGPDISQLLDLKAGTHSLEGMQKTLRRALLEGMEVALLKREPQSRVARSCAAGYLQTSDLLFLPVRWKGSECVLIFARCRPQSQNILDAIFTASADALLILAPLDQGHDFEIVTLNSAAAYLLGTGVLSACWERLSRFLVGNELYMLRQQLKRIAAGNAAPTFEFAHTSDGKKFHLHASVVQSGDLIALNFSDITDLKQREDSVQQLFECNPIPHILFDPVSLEIVKVNRAVLQKYGYAAEELIGESLLTLHPEEEHDLVRAKALAERGHQPTEGSWTHIRACGDRINVTSYSRQIELNQRSLVLASTIDVTQQKLAEAQIAHMAHHDHLTGLANRILLKSWLDDALKGLVRRNAKAAVLCLDLDDFKQVNDTMGHPIGDALLRQVSERLRSFGSKHVLLARLGGDEFAVISANVTDPQDTAQLAGQLIEKLSAGYEIAGHTVRIGVSIGISVAPTDGLTSEDLFKQADIALYRAKEDGKGTYRFFEAEMNLRLQKKRSMEADLRTAIEQGQFELYYQPLMDADVSSIVCCEALLRWNHPTLGLIPPTEFIPLAEETGLIIPIGDWVLNEACSEATQWPDNIKVAVNLSPVQFRSRRLLQSILSALTSAGLPACRLELEITESVLFANSEANFELLETLRAAGVCISMDDFGTGYSSLSYLRSFPFDKLKLDRSFIEDLHTSADCKAIVRAIALLGSSLKITTVAEGVETQDQLVQLQAEGYKQMQGYLFHRPQPAEKIRKILTVDRPTDYQRVG